jgi:hypothetical protein
MYLTRGLYIGKFLPRGILSFGLKKLKRLRRKRGKRDIKRKEGDDKRNIRSKR